MQPPLALACLHNLVYYVKCNAPLSRRRKPVVAMGSGLLVFTGSENLMPVVKRGAYWYMGKKRFKTKKAAEAAYRAYLAKKKK